jgi:chromosome segregation ATPase
VNRILTGLLIAATLALCGLCAVQWKREAEFRIRIQEIGTALKEESTKRAEAEEQVLTFEKEIARLTTLRADTEAKLLEVSTRLVSVEADQLHRGNSIAVLGVELERARVEAKTAKEKIAAQEKTNTVVEQNAAITQANALLKQLTTERDSAIEKLNERTRALNELVTKYNKLVK